MDELSVVGLDLRTGREVTINDESDVPYWRRRGHGGERSVVCLHCYLRHDHDRQRHEPRSNRYGCPDRPDDGGARRREVPLVARGRVLGARRAHFAHPPGHAPRPGEHHPESVWHAAGKQELARWARIQPGVEQVRVEAWTADGRRRSDVQVRLRGGARVALELQSRWITDDEWLRRHEDYQQLGICDVWLWSGTVGVPGIIRDHELPGWEYAQDRRSLTALIGRGRRREHGWWDQPDLTAYGPGWPARRDDRVVRHHLTLGEVTLTRDGLGLPDSLLQRWRDQTAAAADAARAADVARTAEANDAAACVDRGFADAPHGSGDASALPVSSAGVPCRPSVLSAPAPRPAVIRVDARAPEAAPEHHLYLCRACDVTFPGGLPTAHTDCSWGR